MKCRWTTVATVGLFACASGCALKEIKGKSKFGSEWRHSGGRSTSEIRYSVEEGLAFKFDKGYDAGVSYRRRDIDDGSGDGDNGLFIDFSIPLWKADRSEEKSAERIRELELRLASLERQLGQVATAPTAGNQGVPTASFED